jgi:hypothetical protein
MGVAIVDLVICDCRFVVDWRLLIGDWKVEGRDGTTIDNHESSIDNESIITIQRSSNV